MLTVWVTGLSGSGKTTLAREVARQLDGWGLRAWPIDGDDVRDGLSVDLDHSLAGRAENVRRVGEVALLAARAGIVPVVAMISPIRVDRERVRARHDRHHLRFVEVYMDVPVEVCRERDPHGIYRLADAGKLAGVPGVDQRYEPPEKPDVIAGGELARDAAAVLDVVWGRTPTVR